MYIVPTHQKMRHVSLPLTLDPNMLYYVLVNKDRSVRINVPAFACTNSPIHTKLVKAEPRLAEILAYERECDMDTRYMYECKTVVTVLSEPSERYCNAKDRNVGFTAKGNCVMYASAEEYKAYETAAKAAKKIWVDEGKPVPDYKAIPAEALEYEVPDMTQGFADMLRAILWPRFMVGDYEYARHTYEAASYFDQQLFYSFLSPFGNHKGDFTFNTSCHEP